MIKLELTDYEVKDILKKLKTCEKKWGENYEKLIKKLERVLYEKRKISYSNKLKKRKEDKKKE